MVLTVLPSWGETVRHGAPVARVSGEGGRTVVWLSGEYDVATLTALAERLATAIALDDADVVVDLTEVQFIDAATVGMLIRARDFLQPRSRHLTLRNPPRRVRRVLEVCGLTGLIDGAPVDAGQAMDRPAPASRLAAPLTDRADRPPVGPCVRERNDTVPAARLPLVTADP
jgi:anti-anti-sigma factor